VSEALKAALSELTSMREARRRTEDMVAGLVQQRDLYRAIAEETDTTRAHTPSKASTALTIVGSPNSEQGRVSDLQWKLTQAEDERRRLQERMNRLEEAEKLTHESLDRIRGEASAVRMEAAQANSDARFQRERAERLDISLKAAQLESASALQRRLDIERTLIDLQREIRTKDDKVAELSDQLRSSADAQRRADIEVEVAKASETRVVAQLCEAREEVKRHASLAEYLQRIEAGLQSKAEEDKEALVREKDALTRAYETLRRQVDERGLIEDQRLRCLEDDLRSAKSRLDEKTSEATAVSSELIREQCIAKAAQERSSLLEKQLSIAQERLNASQGVQIMDSISTSEAAAKELQFERSVAEVESLKAQLAASEGHAEQFRRISTANEASLKELRAKSQETRAVQEAEASRLQTERDSAVRELAEHRASTVTLLNEVEESREQLRAANSANAESTRAHQEQLALARQESEQLREQLELLKADAVKFQAAAKSAFANYERELQMHAQAEKDLREKDRELEVTKDSLSAAQQRAASLSADCLRKESVLEEERGKFEAESQLLQSQLEGLQRTNDLLHAQVQSFGVQIDRLQDTRLAAASLEQNVGTNDANQQPSTMNVEELMELRKSNLEIREVLRYLKKEKDMLAAKLAVVETENNRHLGELHVVNRALDEARAELKRELDRRVVVRSEEEFSRLLSEVTQLNLVRESNAHLRGENEELSRRVVTLTDELRVQKTAKVPLEEALRKSQADKESMELINDQLNNDVGYWRDRLQKLVSRYNDVDPEEHRLLKAQLEEVQIALADLQKVSAAQVLENTAALEARDKELSALKVTAQSQEKGANNLRDRLRQFKVAKDAVDAKLVESGKLVASRETELTALGAQLTAVQTEVVTLTASLATAQAEIIAVKSAPVSQIVEAALSSVPTVVPEVNIVAPVVAPTKKRDRATHEAETTTTTTIAPAIAPTLIVAGASETATPSSGAAPVVEENKMKQLLKQKAQNIAIAKKKAAAAAAAQQSTEVTVAEPIVAAAPVGKKARVAIAPSLSDTAVEVSETPSVPDNSSTVVMDTEANAPVIVSAPLTIEAPETVSSAAEPASVEMLTEPIAPTVDAPVAAIPEAKKIGSGNPFSSATTPVAKPAVNIFGASAVVIILFCL
jgi:nucleoprotein TPR